MQDERGRPRLERDYLSRSRWGCVVKCRPGHAFEKPPADISPALAHASNTRSAATTATVLLTANGQPLLPLNRGNSVSTNFRSGSGKNATLPTTARGDR